MNSTFRRIAAALTVVFAWAALGAAPTLASAPIRTPLPQWQRALELRSQGLDQKYHLDAYAPTSAGTGAGFDWGAASAGAATMLVALGGLGALTLAVRTQRPRARA
jgi:hypothetical protein